MAVYANFDHDADFLELLLLYENPNPILAGVNLVYDTNARGADPR
jgi:hypothetical protein